MATNEKFILEFVTKGTEGIDRAKDKIEGVNRAVSGLATALLGVSFTSFISGALQAADRISDFSDATNISISSLKALEAAMDAAGGKGKNLEKAVNQLYAAIDTANSGSLQARDAFAKVGVSLDMLKNMSEADVLQKTIEGLAKMPAGAERSAIATTLLSKAFRGIDPAQLLDALDPAKYAASEEATKKAAAAQQELEKKYKTLQEGAIVALEDILKLFGQHNLTVESATKLVQALGVAFAVLIGAQAVAGVASMVTALVKMNQALAITAGLSNLLGKTPLALIAKLAAGGALTAGVAVSIDELIKKNDELADSAAKAGNAQAGALGAPAVPGTIQQAAPQTGAAGRNQELDARQKAILDSERRIRQSQIEVAKFSALQGANDLMKIDIEAASDIAKAKEEINAKEHLSRAQKAAEFAAKEKEILGKAAMETAKFRAEQNAKIFSEEESQRQANAEALAAMDTAYAKGAQTALDRAAAYGRSVDELKAQVDLEDRLRGMNEIQANTERQVAAEIKRRTDAIRELATVENLAYEERQKREAQITQDSERAIEIIKKRGEAELERSRSFQVGWEEAFRKYQESAYNSADQARQIFDTFTKGFEDAMVRFAMTGKLSFKDLANSIIADIIRIQAKKIALGLFGGAGGAGGILGGMFSGVGGFLSGLFKANGGPVGANSPYIVGERGPELFVPRTAGNIIPNNQMAMGSSAGGTLITYNINAVDAASFKSMVARDPQFIYQVTEKGRRSQPTRSRA